MTPLQFSTVARLIYPLTWMAGVSEGLNVSLRNVQKWATGSKDIPPGVARDLLKIARSVYAQDGYTAEGIDQILEILNQIIGAENPESRDHG